MKFVQSLVLIALLIGPSFAGSAEMEKRELYQALKSFLEADSSKDKDYLDVVSWSEQYEFESIESPYIQGYALYKFRSLDPRLASYQFIFATKGHYEDFFILSENLDNFNRIAKFDANTLTKEEVENLVNDCLALTRPFHKFFDIMDDSDKLKRWSIKRIPNGQLPKPLEMEGGRGNFHGEVILLLGRNLIKRKIIVNNEKLMFEDTVLEYSATKYRPIHSSDR